MKKQKILYSVHPTSLLEVSFSKLQLRVIPVVRALVTFVGAALPLPSVVLKFLLHAGKGGMLAFPLQLPG